jgi:hypothetical protein
VVELIDKSAPEESLLKVLGKAGLQNAGVQSKLLRGGANNKVLAVETTEGKYLAKFYYREDSGTRNRLQAEFSFISYAWAIGIRCVPKPIFFSPEENVGIYEFIAGRKVSEAELTAGHVMQAAGFIRALNDRSDRDENLPLAAEACFTLQEHFSLIDRRIQRLIELPLNSQLDRELSDFVRGMERHWTGVKEELSRHTIRFEELETADRCISPSDFGMHNALLRESGELCFLDFEYAGWDDPAKLVSDFFCQPAVPVGIAHFENFATEALAYSKNRLALIDRARLLYPVFAIKWCCIMLNEFLPEVARRRSFADAALDIEASRLRQLGKARNFLHHSIGVRDGLH